LPTTVSDSLIRRFDPQFAASFIEKPVSEETRRAYRTAVGEFFRFVKGFIRNSWRPGMLLAGVMTCTGRRRGLRPWH
jgi:hypothetical protein